METNDNKKNELRKLIVKLSKSVCDPADISLYTEELKSIYTYNFRHSYSSITGCIMDEYMSCKDEVVFANITQNLQTIIDSCTRPIDAPFVCKIEKLLDHISLEYARVQRIYSEYESRVKIAEDKLRDATKLSTETLESADKLKTEVITILSIFAAIVLAFMGGMSFTAGTFSGLSNASFFRVASIALICGFVIFNTISILLYIVSKLINKSILIKCKSENECICVKKCRIFNRVRKRLPFIFWINAFLILFMLLMFIGWLTDINDFATWLQSKFWYCQ